MDEFRVLLESIELELGELVRNTDAYARCQMAARVANMPTTAVTAACIPDAKSLVQMTESSIIIATMAAAQIAETIPRPFSHAAILS